MGEVVLFLTSLMSTVYSTCKKNKKTTENTPESEYNLSSGTEPQTADQTMLQLRGTYPLVKSPGSTTRVSGTISLHAYVHLPLPVQSQSPPEKGNDTESISPLNLSNISNSSLIFNNENKPLPLECLSTSFMSSDMSSESEGNLPIQTISPVKSRASRIARVARRLDDITQSFEEYQPSISISAATSHQFLKYNSLGKETDTFKTLAEYRA